MCYMSHCTNIQQIPYAYPTLGSADYISLLPSSQSRGKISHVQKYYQKIKGKVKNYISLKLYWDITEGKDHL